MIFLLVSWRSVMKIEGSGSISKRHGSADADPEPDPHQNFMDPEHWLQEWHPWYACWHSASWPNTAAGPSCSTPWWPSSARPTSWPPSPGAGRSRLSVRFPGKYRNILFTFVLFAPYEVGIFWELRPLSYRTSPFPTCFRISTYFQLSAYFQYM